MARSECGRIIKPTKGFKSLKFYLYCAYKRIKRFIYILAQVFFFYLFIDICKATGAYILLLMSIYRY
jgi:hypothetical protein